MPLDQSCFDKAVCLCEVVHDTLLVASELDEVLVQVHQCVGTLDDTLVQSCGSIPERKVGDESQRSCG